MKKIILYFKKIFNPHFLFIYTLTTFTCFRINNIFKLRLNILILIFFIILIAIIIYINRDFCNKFFKNNFFFIKILYNLLNFKNHIYKIIFFFFNITFNRIGKYLLVISCFSFFSMITYFLYFNFWIGTIIYIFLLIYSLSNLIENYIITNYFKEDDIINFNNIKTKLHLNKNILLNQNTNFQYIHYRYFEIPKNVLLKKYFKKFLIRIGGTAIIGGIMGFGRGAYHNMKIRKQVRSHNQENFEKNIQNLFKNCEEELESLKDTSTFFDLKKNQTNTKEEYLKKSQKCAQYWNQITKDPNLNIKVPSIFEDFF